MCLHLRVEASLIKSLHEFSWALGVDVANARTRLDMLGFPAQPVVDARAMLSVKAEIEWPGEAGRRVMSLSLIIDTPCNNHGSGSI